MRRFSPLLLLSVLLCTGIVRAQPVPTLEVNAPKLILSGVNFNFEVLAKDSAGSVVTSFSGAAALSGVQLAADTARFVEGKLLVKDAIIPSSGSTMIGVEVGGFTASREVRVVPGWLSILPPLVAILLALLLRQVVISLFTGIWVGAIILFDYNVFGGIFRVLDHFIVKALSDVSHIQIILFSMLFGGMVGVISRNGGTVGIANLITRYARSARGGAAGDGSDVVCHVF